MLQTCSHLGHKFQPPLLPWLNHSRKEDLQIIKPQHFNKLKQTECTAVSVPQLQAGVNNLCLSHSGTLQSDASQWLARPQEWAVWSSPSSLARPHSGWGCCSACSCSVPSVWHPPLMALQALARTITSWEPLLRWFPFLALAGLWIKLQKRARRLITSELHDEGWGCQLSSF